MASQDSILSSGTVFLVGEQLREACLPFVDSGNFYTNRLPKA